MSSYVRLDSRFGWVSPSRSAPSGYDHIGEKLSNCRRNATNFQPSGCTTRFGNCTRFYSPSVRPSLLLGAMDVAHDAFYMAQAFLGAILQVFLLVIRQQVPTFHKILKDVFDLAQVLFRMFPVHVPSIEKAPAVEQGQLQLGRSKAQLVIAVGVNSCAMQVIESGVLIRARTKSSA
jgi:hypothetical protein